MRSRGSRTGHCRYGTYPQRRPDWWVRPVLADYVRTDAVFSNIRLRGIGFRFEYPTLRQGLERPRSERTSEPEA